MQRGRVQGVLGLNFPEISLRTFKLHSDGINRAGGSRRTGARASLRRARSRRQQCLARLEETHEVSCRKLAEKSKPKACSEQEREIKRKVTSGRKDDNRRDGSSISPTTHSHLP